MKFNFTRKKHLLIFLLFFVFTLSAQRSRPKIGLTLSGGGAKGLARYGLTLGYNSPIGPMEFTVMYCDQDRKVRTNINIDYSF